MKLVPVIMLLSCSALGDIYLKNAGGNVGPITSLNCMADAGLLCTRDAGSVGTIKCNGATATEAGCVTPQAQTYAGDKTFTGTVKAVILDAGVASVGSLDMRASSIGNRNAASTLLIASNTADGTTTSTVGAMTLQCAAAITSTDACLDVQDSAGNHRLRVTAGGALNYTNLITDTGTTGNAGASLTVAVGAGATATTFIPAGTGGGLSITTGAGGASSGLQASAPAGDMSLVCGNGGADNGAQLGSRGGTLALQAGNGGRGGTGGNVTLISGAGGAATASHAAASGGVLQIAAGAGGDEAAGGTAQAGGAIAITAGSGGTNITGATGTGGALSLTSGGGGAVGAGAGSAAGAVVLDTGATTGAATAATMSIGATNAGAITLGRVAQPVSIPGTLASTGAATFTGNVIVGTSGTSFSNSKSVSGNIDFALIGAQTCVDNTLTGLTNCINTDPVSCALPATLEAGLAGSCFMSAAATVTFRLCNVTGAGINPALQTFGARCIH